MGKPNKPQQPHHPHHSHLVVTYTRLRQKLADEGVLPEFVEVESERVMAELSQI
jgi:hypothetical protein